MSGGTNGSDDDDGQGARADPKDFAAVYADKADNLRAFAASVLRGAGLQSHTEDVVQEAITGLWAKYQETNEVPRSWLAMMMTAVRRRAIDLIRSADVRRAGFSMDDEDVTFEPAEPGDFAEDHANSHPVRAALDALTDEQQREVLHRIYYEDQSQAQVAKDLGLTPGRITQIKQAALNEIASHIDEQ